MTRKGKIAMRKEWAMALVLLCGGCGGADAGAARPEAPVAGGWSPVDPSDSDVQGAARFAANLVPAGHGGLDQVDRAESQVVAGTNYRLVLRFADGQHWQATVWQRLDGSFRLLEAEPLPAKR